MTKRLTHTDAGLVRSMQISNTRFFAFVEGGLDRPFVDKTLRASLKEEKYKIYSAKELPGNTGGKPRLLQLFNYLNDQNLLLNTFNEKETVVAFYLDKDADEIQQSLVNSHHIIYTSTYDIEGHLFSCGNITQGLSDAANITYEQAQMIISNPHDWLKNLVLNWTDWIVLCLLSSTLNIENSQYTFGRLSSIHDPNELISTPKPTLLANAKQDLLERSGLPHDEFFELYRQYESTVRGSITSGTPLKLFKGKWLKTILEKHCRKHSIPDANFQSLGERIVTALLSQVDPDSECQCSQSMRSSVVTILGLLH